MPHGDTSLWYRLNDQPETNDNELKLSAIMGTAIHAEIEKAIATASGASVKVSTPAVTL